MNCPVCGKGNHRVLRSGAREGGIQRMRECVDCGHRWQTIEAPVAVLERANDIVAAFETMKRLVPGE